MLDSIEIRNFKKIGENGLKLDKLTNVNYLVGENGCGKSSVLEGVRFYNSNLSEVSYKKLSSLNSYGQKLYQYMKEKDDLYFANLIIDENLLQQLPKAGTGTGFEITLETKSGAKSKYFMEKDDLIFENKIDFYCIQLFSDIYRSLTNRDTKFSEYVFKEVTGQLFEVGFSFMLAGSKVSKEDLLKKHAESNIVNFDRAFKNMHRAYVKYLGVANVTDFEHLLPEHNNHEFQEKISLICGFLDDLTGSPENTFCNENNLSDGQGFILRLAKIITWVSVELKDKLFLLCIEEPEKNLHPSYCKLLPKLFEHFTGNPNLQFLISTHSPFIVSAALELDNQKVFHLEKGELAGEVSKNDLKSFNSALDGLGVKPSDMMFANGVVWVEGPTDAIYIEKWLEMYQIENVKTVKYRSGLNYQFQMYGGALLKHYTDDTDLKKSITDMLKINTKRFVVFDSDIEEEVDKSTFGKYKTAVMDEIKDNNFYWYDTEIKTIEDYIPDQSRAEAYRVKADKPKSGDKYKHAIKNIQKWEVEKLKLENFDPHLEPQIAKVFKAIENWNK